MKKQTAIAVLFLLLCGVLSVVAIGAKLEGLKQEQAFLGGLARDVWDLKEQAGERDLFDAQQQNDIGDLNQRISILEVTPPRVEIEGDAYCLVSTSPDGITVLSCKPFS